MNIGIPKEIKAQENRVSMIPGSVAELVKRGHRVIVQRGAGEGASYPDELYTAVGAEIVADAAAVFAAAELIVKVKEPQASEVAMLKPHHILFTRRSTQMKNLSNARAAFTAICLTVLSVCAPTAQAAPPDLTTAALPRVLLIGDSIREGYQEVVKQRLAGKADVAAIPCNGEYTGTGIKKLDQWLGDGKWDVIHFNWGLWDMYGWEYAKEDRSPAMYEERLESLVLRLKKTGAKLVWATTTPVCTAAETTMLERFNTKLRIAPDTERQYLDAALRVMNKHHIQIDDLHGCMAPESSKYAAGPDNVHYTEAGYAMLGRQAAASILAALTDRTAPEINRPTRYFPKARRTAPIHS